MFKKTVIIVLIGLIHFALSAGVVPMALKMATANASEVQTPSVMFRILAGVTKILYFPIISLAWYSRQWFPGNWIYIPICLNSLLWATGIYLVYYLCQKLQKQNTD